MPHLPLHLACILHHLSPLQPAAVTGKARLFLPSLGGLTLESLNKYLSSARAKYRETNVYSCTTPMPIVGN